MRFNEKSRTGTDTIKLSASKIATMLVTLASSMLLSRFRTLTEYGTYSQLLLSINLVCSILSLGLPNSINYFLAKASTQEERDRFLSVYYTLNTLLSLAAGIVLTLSIPVLELFFKNDLIRTFWFFLAFYPWTIIIMSSVENLLVVYHKTVLLILFRLLNGISLLSVILIVQWTGGNFTQYMITYIGVEAAFTFWTYIIVRRNTERFRPSLNKTAVFTILKFSIPLGLASVVGTINIELDKLIITSFMTTEDLAVYTNASKELPVTLIATSLTAVLMPQLVRLLKNDKAEEAVSLWKSATTISFAILAVIAIGCFAFAPEVVTLLYSDLYIGGVSVFRIYCLVLLLRCTYFGMILNSTGNTKFILFSSLGSLGLNVVFNYLCFFLFGFVGPAIATLASSILMNLFQLFYTGKKIAIPFRRMFPWLKCLTCLCINAALGVGFWFLKNLICRFFGLNAIVVAIVLGCVWAVVFLFLARKPLLREWHILNAER